MIPVPDLAELKLSLTYDQGTGIFMRRERADRPDSWNRQFANKRAGALRADGYVQITVERVIYLAHHLAWLYVHGEFPADMEEMDHANGNRSDNRLCNLRPASKAQNRANSKRRADKSRNLPKGVRECCGKYQARIHRNGSTQHLGSFTSPELAHAAYAAAAVGSSGEFARLS